MKETPKALEEGESTYLNGSGGAMCGGVVSKSLFDSNPWAYMMAYYMDDEKFALYRAAKNSGNEKKARQIFEKYARSAI